MKKFIRNNGYKILGILVLAFWYSGFAAYERFDEKGMLIFTLPVIGVIAAVFLFSIFSYIYIKYNYFCNKAWIDIPITIGLPFIIPFIAMIAIREKDFVLVIKVSMAFICSLVILMILIALLELQEEWHFLLKILLIIGLFLSGYLFAEYGPNDVFEIKDVLKKYEPFGSH
jgi:hypothetical protein